MLGSFSCLLCHSVCWLFWRNYFRNTIWVQRPRYTFGSFGYLRHLVILNCVLVKTIAYLRHFFLWLHVFLLHEAIRNVFAYLFTPISIKLADFIVPEANLIPLLTFKRVSLSSLCFLSRKTGQGTDILFINLSCILGSLVKKNQYPTGICNKPKWKGNGPNGTQWHHK